MNNSCIAHQYNILSQLGIKQRRPYLVQRLISRGGFFRKKKIRKYKRLALSVLITKKLIFQQFYYSFISRLLKWFKYKIIRETKKYRKCKCVSLKLLRLFYYFSIKEEKQKISKFLMGIPSTILRRRQKELLFSRIKSLMKPLMVEYDFIQGVQGQLYRGKGSVYLEYGYPTGSWIINFFKRRKNRYKVSSLSLFSGYRGRTFFNLRRKRKKKRLNRKRHRYMNKLVKFSKVNYFKYNVVPSYEIRAEVYLKYFYDYSINDLHKIAYQLFKIFPYCSLGLIFYFLNKRLDFLVRRQFCSFRMTLIRDILRKGLVYVNGIVIKDPSYIVKTGHLLSFKLFYKDIYSTSLIGLFISMFSIKNSILRGTLKLKLYKILLRYLRYKTMLLNGLKVPFFKERVSRMEWRNSNTYISLLGRRFLKNKREKKKMNKALLDKRKEKKYSFINRNNERIRVIRSTNVGNVFGKDVQKRFYSSNNSVSSFDSMHAAILKIIRREKKYNNLDKNSSFSLNKQSLMLKKKNYPNIKSSKHLSKSSKQKDYFSEKPKKKRYLIHYKDLQVCKMSYSCKRRFTSLFARSNRGFHKKKFYIEIKRKRDITGGSDKEQQHKYFYKISLRFFRKLRKYKLGWRNLEGRYNVFHWDKDYRVKHDYLKNNRKILIIKYLKMINKQLLYIFLIMCFKQKYLLNNIGFSILSTSTLDDFQCIIRDILSVHRTYCGIKYKFISRSNVTCRIRSFALKLFDKFVKKLDNKLDISDIKKNDLYNIIINASPTKFHNILKVSNYLLLLRYRTALPYFYENSIYFNFECLRINPLTYVRRGCLLYENRPGSTKIMLRDYWFRKNKYYLP